jgi:putative transposase
MFLNIADANGFKIITMEVMTDHVYLLVDCTPQHYIPNIIKDMEICQIKLPKLGWVKFRKSKNLRESTGKIINVNINMTSNGKYLASVLCLAEIQELPEVKDKVGYDLGLTLFANGSNDDIIENPRYFRAEERKLVRLQRQLSRKAKGSKNRQKQRTKVARQHERIANMRKDFLHQQSTRIVRENQVICLEDLQVKNLVKNKRLAKSYIRCGMGNVSSNDNL